MARKQRSDSIEQQVKRVEDAKRVIGIPDGVKFETDEEMILWRQFTAARALDDWREFDLILIAKMIGLETQIRRYNQVIMEEGVISINARGTQIENPLLRVVDTLQRQQLAIIRSLSLGVSASKAQDSNKSGTKAQDRTDLEKLNKGDVVSLLAT